MYEWLPGNLKVTPVLELCCISTFTSVYIHKQRFSAGKIPVQLQYWILYGVCFFCCCLVLGIGIKTDRSQLIKKVPPPIVRILKKKIKYWFQYTQNLVMVTWRHIRISEREVQYEHAGIFFFRVCFSVPTVNMTFYINTSAYQFGISNCNEGIQEYKLIQRRLLFSWE